MTVDKDLEKVIRAKAADLCFCCQAHECANCIQAVIHNGKTYKIGPESTRMIKEMNSPQNLWDD